MNKKIALILASVFMVCFTAFAYETTKPDTHNDAWLELHGKYAAADDSDCITCHVERIECIACHEDVRPRSHNNSWAKKTHGMEARWNDQKCKTCHTEDSCIACHEATKPMNHTRSGFGTQNSAGFHCFTSCQLPFGTWTNTMSQNCITCHRTRPITKSGTPHEIR